MINQFFYSFPTRMKTIPRSINSTESNSSGEAIIKKRKEKKNRLAMIPEKSPLSGTKKSRFFISQDVKDIEKEPTKLVGKQG